ncbi:MAG: hypothetical protein ACRD3J_09380 [Thermoanaerobaculia bacterium]
MTTQAPTALYQGYDSFLGTYRDTAVGGSSTPSDGEISNTVYICTDSQSVSDAVSVSGSLSASGIDGSASAKSTWVQNLNITSTSVVVVVHTVVQIGLQQASDYSLTAAAPASAQDFFKAYGDSFVNELVTGAEYYAAFVYESTTTETQEKISTSLQGSAGILTASLSTTITDVSSDTNTTVSISQQALGISEGVALPGATSTSTADPDSIVTFALNFTTLTFNAPEILAFALMGYENVPGLTESFAPVATNRNLLSSAGNTVSFPDANTTLASLNTTVNQMQTMYDGYQYSADSGFVTKKAQITADYNALTGLISSIESNVTGQFSSLPLPSLAYGTPNASYVIKPTLFTTAGTQFCDLSSSQILDGTTISSLVLLSAGFTVTYTDTTRQTHGSGSQQGSVTIAGNDSIKLLGLPMLQPASNYQIGLVETESGQVAGDQNSDWLEIKSPPMIIGFSGAQVSSTPAAMFSLQPITISFSPAVWVSGS